MFVGNGYEVLWPEHVEYSMRDVVEGRRHLAEKTRSLHDKFSDQSSLGVLELRTDVICKYIQTLQGTLHSESKPESY